MKIAKEEIIKLSNSVMIELSDKEIEEIQESIVLLSNKLNDMFELKVDCEPKIMQVSEVNQFNQVFESEVDVDQMMNNINGFDQTYVKTGKVINDEE